MELSDDRHIVISKSLLHIYSEFTLSLTAGHLDKVLCESVLFTTSARDGLRRTEPGLKKKDTGVNDCFKKDSIDKISYLLFILQSNEKIMKLPRT